MSLWRYGFWDLEFLNMSSLSLVFLRVIRCKQYIHFVSSAEVEFSRNSVSGIFQRKCIDWLLYGLFEGVGDDR